jgi:hypothetical protein
LSVPPHPSQPGLECEALHRARGEHVVELVDVSSSADEHVLVFPRLPRGSLAEVLTVRRGLDAGEAVTVLAPVAAGLARMHAAGVAHGAVSAEHVLFDAQGAPVLIGFGQATLFEPGMPEVGLEQLPGVIDDRRALAALAVEVLGRVTGARAAAAAAFAERLRGASPDELATLLAEELFELAAARPVVFGSEESERPSPRAVGVQPVAEPDGPAAPAGLLERALLTGPAVIARERVRALWGSWSPVRRRMTLAIGVAALVVVVAVAVTPGAPAAVIDAPVASSASPGTAAAIPESVTSDDPLEALDQLLSRRAECLREVSVLCLDDVDQQGSAALDDDRQVLDAVLADGAVPPPLSADGAAVVERLGDSALIALAPDSDPASVLLLKGEAGWRIRDYLSRRQSED